MSKKVDLTGKRFGYLVAIRSTGDKYHGGAIWECKCDCGNNHNVPIGRLTSGNSKSCGCQKYKIKHGQAKTRIYKIYGLMIQRCYNSHNTHYLYYGGRGIILCDEWMNSFEAFRDWAVKNGYSEKLTIDRIDANGNYEPNNCRWVTRKEQMNNTRRNVNIEINGESRTLAQWAENTNVSSDAVRSRYKRGKSGSDLILPLQSSKEIKIDISGILYTFNQLSETTNISVATLKTRYYKGLRGEKLIEPLKRIKKYQAANVMEQLTIIEDGEGLQ